MPSGRSSMVTNLSSSGKPVTVAETLWMVYCSAHKKAAQQRYQYNLEFSTVNCTSAFCFVTTVHATENTNEFILQIRKRVLVSWSVLPGSANLGMSARLLCLLMSYALTRQL